MSWTKEKQDIVNSIAITLESFSSTVLSVCRTDIKPSNDDGDNYHVLMTLLQMCTENKFPAIHKFIFRKGGIKSLCLGALPGFFRLKKLEREILNTLKMDGHLDEHECPFESTDEVFDKRQTKNHFVWWFFLFIEYLSRINGL